MDGWESWEKLLVGILAVLMLLYFSRGAKSAFANSRKAERSDWMNLLWPMLMVVLFVIFLISLV